MRNVIRILLNFILLPAIAYAQQDTTISLDLLRAPSSPGFVILGVEPSEIERPNTPNDFAISILNATNNLSALPKNYSLEFAPGWIFGGRHITFEDFASNNILPNIWQTWTMSLAVVTTDVDSNTQRTKMGFGIKASLFRGKFNKEFKKNSDKRFKQLAKYNTILKQSEDEAIKKDTLYRQLQASFDFLRKKYEDNTDASLTDFYLKMLRGITEAMQLRMAHIHSETIEKVSKEQKEILDSLRQAASEIKFDRWGPKLDVAGGLALDFPDRRLNFSKVLKAGFWLTGGFESEDKWSVLGVGRLLVNPKQEVSENDTTVNKDIVNLDLGLKAVIDKIMNFSLSFEYILRKYYDVQDNSLKFKYDLSLGYELGKNKLLTFSIGRNFEGITTTGGNLIASLNLILGFGSKR